MVDVMEGISNQLGASLALQEMHDTDWDGQSHERC